MRTSFERGYESVGITILFVLAVLVPLGVQAQGTTAVQHAEIGRLEAIGGHDDRIVTALPVRGDVTVYRTYDTDFDTGIVGLGDIMEVGAIPQEALDNVVVVTFVPGQDRPLAKRLYFPDEQEVLETRGVVESVDTQEELLVVRTPEGETRLDLGDGPGTTIDSNQGLLQASDLESGQEVSVYHADPAELAPDDVAEAFVVFVHG